MRSEIKRYKFKEDEIDQFQLINLNKYKIRDIIKSQQKLDFNEMLQYLVQYIKESVSEIVQDLNALIQIFLNKHISKQSLHQLFSQIISTYQDKGEKQNKLQLCIFEEITNSLQQLLTIEQLSDLQKFIESIQQHKNDIKFLQKENDQHFFLNYLSTRVLRQVFNKKKDEFKLPSSLICEDIGESIQFACSVKIMREEETSTIEGQYDADGRKVGIWRELFKNYQEDQQIIYVGQYSMSKKLGRWNILADHYIIGGGEYDKNGQKVGLWVEISEKFNRFCKIIYVGDYQNGLKFGQWNTLENDHTIESGAYDGQGRKVGSWIELDPNYNEQFIQNRSVQQQEIQNCYEGRLCEQQKDWQMVDGLQKLNSVAVFIAHGDRKLLNGLSAIYNLMNCQIIATGEYENGNRVGVWEYQNNSLVVGGGTYNKNGLKQGQWLEPQEEDNIDVVYFRGNYKDGKRVDQWNIFNTDNCVIGGGYYDINGNKCKLWTDFFNLSSVKFIGKYQNSRKIGLWKSIKFEQLAKDTIFGGCFNKNEQKIGLWNELIENYSETCKLSFQGLYLNGKKILRWDTIYDNKKIGGGRYDLRGNKVGKWIEQIKDFSNKCQVLYFGEYSYGCKIGIWGVQYAQNRSFNLKVIGQGQYNSKSQKSGKWLEIDQNFNKFNINFKNKLVFAQFLIEGIIKMDIKSGHGSVYKKKPFCNKQVFKKRAQGNYNKYGIKIGKWIELSSNFSQLLSIQMVGKYKNGLKIGKWTIKYQQEEIGEGNFNQQGLKNGAWKILHDNFQENCQVIMKGKFQNGKKVEEWNILDLYRDENNMDDGYIIYVSDYTIQDNIDQDRIIGGGYHDQNGIKNGRWIDLDENYKNYEQNVTHQFYQDGIQIDQRKY